MNKNKIKTRIFKSSILILISLFFNLKGYSENEIIKSKSLKKEFNYFLSEDNPWILGYSDNTIKVYYQKINCEGHDSYKLWVINLTKSEVKIAYKFWENSIAKAIVLTPFANLEGICSQGYNYPLIEQIPTEKNNQKIKLTIQYQK